ncbi:MAG: nitroreductase family protein [Spirochaetales bacterium]
MDTLYLIKNRKNVFHFNKKEVDAGMLAEILNCARVTPTNEYEQVWKFIIIKNKDMKSKISQIVGLDYIFECNVLIAVFSEDRKFKREYAASAVEAMTIAANANGIGVNWQICYGEKYAKQIEALLDSPEQLRLMSLVTLGYYDFISPVFKTIPSLSEIIAYEKFK